MKELTDFVEQLIVILKEEVEAGILTPLESYDYIQLLLKASKHIFHNYPKYHEEVWNMTKPMLKVPSMEIRELQWTLAEKDASLEEKDATIAEKDASLAEKDATIAELRQQLAALQSNQQD